jgi:hypothetical protein
MKNINKYKIKFYKYYLKSWYNVLKSPENSVAVDTAVQVSLLYADRYSSGMCPGVV